MTRPDPDASAACIAALRRATRERFQAAGLTSAALEADLLLTEASGLDRGRLLAWPERVLSESQQASLEALISRRLAGEPIAYLLGRREFWSLELQVSPATLIPRPETETLVEQALLALPETAALRVADLGTGSGAIAAALAYERPRWSLVGIDESPDALRVAARNARRLGLKNVHLMLSHWCSALKTDALDAVLANPPYVCADDPHLAQGDLRFEPQSALVAGADGLDAIRAIVADAPRCLEPGGLLALEHGWDQGPQVRALLREQGFEKIETLRDLAGQERVTRGRR